MPPQSRPPIPRPALWIAAPTFIVSLAVAAGLQAGIFAAVVIAVLGAIAVGVFAERRLARIISSIDRIARGDRYTSLPELVGDGAIQRFAGTAETVRAALIEADTLTVDQLRRETEARLHRALAVYFSPAISAMPSRRWSTPSPAPASVSGAPPPNWGKPIIT